MASYFLKIYYHQKTGHIFHAAEIDREQAMTLCQERVAINTNYR